jgi:hypothetical protein
VTGRVCFTVCVLFVFALGLGSCGLRALVTGHVDPGMGRPGTIVERHGAAARAEGAGLVLAACAVLFAAIWLAKWARDSDDHP